jgi:hypothetical protein
MNKVRIPLLQENPKIQLGIWGMILLRNVGRGKHFIETNYGEIKILSPRDFVNLIEHKKGKL